MTEPVYFRMLEDLTFLDSWVAKPIFLTIDYDQYAALLMGYYPHWDMRFGLIYRFLDGYFYAFRSGWVVGKYRFEKRGSEFMCSEAYENPGKPDCYVIFEILKEACMVNKVAFSGIDCSRMVQETTRMEKEVESRQRISDSEERGVIDVVRSDDPFTAKMRKKQSDWRRRQNLQAGARRGKKSDEILGNLLVDGEQTGRNFYFKETFEYAKWRVQTKLPDETIESNRLFNNLLSSQPMAFNLFHPLMMLKNENPEVIDTIIKKAFPDCKELHRVTEIGLEFIPTPKENYTNDMSAMDAFIRFQDTRGENYLIAIETKYTDRLGTNVASEKGIIQQKAIIEELGMFEKDFSITQVFRNFLLAEKYGRIHGLKKVYSVIVAPEDHPTTKNELKPLVKSLKEEYRDRVMSISLEDIIEALDTCPDARYLRWAEWLKDRYV